MVSSASLLSWNFTIHSSSHLCHVYWPSWYPPSFRRFHGLFLRIGHRLQLIVGASYCTGHILWSIKWSRTIPYAWNTHAEIHACCFNDECVPFDHLVQHRTNSQGYAPRQSHIQGSRLIHPVHDPEFICIRSSSVHSQVLANPKDCVPNGANFWNCSCASCPFVLAFGFQVRAWNQRSSLGQFHIVLDKCNLDFSVCEVLFCMQTLLDRFFQDGPAQPS